MVIIGLLLIALVCLVLGLMLQSSVWLVASLIATAGAGYLLYRLREVIAAPKAARPVLTSELPEDLAKSAMAQRALRNENALGEADPDDSPQFDEDAAQPAAAVDDAQATAQADDEVWVIDGRPRYHRGDCAIIKGQDAEPIPYEQATEDGFMSCSLCEPDAVTRPPR